MVKKLPVVLMLFFLVSCVGINLPSILNTPVVQFTQPPKIVSPTFPYLPSSTPAIFSPTFIFSASPTFTASFTDSASPTVTAVVPILEMDVLGCNTSLDVTHGMGEVTNAFPIIRNRTGQTLTGLCGTLSATDEDRLHPDKTACIDLLPPSDQVVLKLTVDTGFKQDTSIEIDVTSNEGFTAQVVRPSCTNIGLPGWVPLKVGVVEPIP
jgi:hypothetical protein